MPKSNKKKSKSKRANNHVEPTQAFSRPSGDDDDDDDSGMPHLEPAAADPPPPKSSRTGLSPELESVHFSTTASLHAMAASPELGKTAQDLYRSLDRDIMSIPEDSDYWLSLPPTIKSFVQNAYAHGMFPVSGGAGAGEVDKERMYTAAQQMIANGIQPPGSKRNGTGGGAIATPPYPPGAYPSFPPFDPAMFSDPAFTQALEQLVPRPGGQSPSANSVLHHDYGGAGAADEFSEDEEDEVELDVKINGHARKATAPVPAASQPPAAKVPAAPGTGKNQQKKAGKTNVSVPPTPSLPPPPNPVPNPPTQTKQAPIQSIKPQAPSLAPPSRPAPTPTSVLPPSSRAAGKQPMSYPPTPNSAAVPPPRSARANGKAPATATNHYHHHPSPPASTNAVPTKPRPPASATTTPAAPLATPPAPPGTVTPGQPPGGKKKENKIWSSSTIEDRERIKEFWLGLPEKDRKKLVELEKDAVLKKMKEQQRHSCGCAVCGRKRSAIEDELEVLYDAYYDELESYANKQQQYVDSRGAMDPPPGPGPFPGSVEIDPNGHVIPNDLTKHPAPPVMADEEYDDDDEDYDEEVSEEGSEDDEDEDDQEQMPAAYPKGQVARRSNTTPRTPQKGVVNGTGPGKRAADAAQQDFFTFGPGLTVAGNILTVADDLLKNDGTKFLEMMEQLAERRMYREEMAASAMMDDEDSEDDDDGSDDDSISDEDDEDDEDEDELTEEHKMEEGRRMFSIFAARMFEQRVLVAYREKVAQDRQLQLIKELEEEDRAAAERDAKKTRDNQKKKDKRKQQKQAKEEEASRRARELAEKEAADKARKAAQEEEARKRRDEDRVKREVERKAREEEKMRKELERRKRLAEEKEAERKVAADRKKEKEDKEREAAKLKKDKEDKERVEKEKQRKLDADKAAAEAERLRDEAAKRAKEEQERLDREAEAAKKAADDKAAAAAKAAAAPPPVPVPTQAPRRVNGAPQGKKAPPKLSTVSGPSSSSSSLPTPVAVTAMPRPSPTPSAIPIQSAQQRLAPSPGLPMGPIGRRATAPALNASPIAQPGPSNSGGMLPQIPFPGMYAPPSPASMSFNGGPNGMPFGMQMPPQQQRPPAPLQPSPLPQFGDPMAGFHAPPQQQSPFAPGPSMANRRNGSPGPNSMMSPGAIAPPGAIGSGFSPGPVTTAHSRRSSLDPIGPRTTFGAITRPIAPIGTRPGGSSSVAPGTPSLASSSKLLDGDDMGVIGKGSSPGRRSDSPERLGSSALLDPTDEPLPSSSGRRGAPFWPTTTDLGKSPDPRFGGGNQWNAFPLPGSAHPLPPPPASPWGVSPTSLGPGGSWPAPGRASFSPIVSAGGAAAFFGGGGPFTPMPPPFGAVGGPSNGGGGTAGNSSSSSGPS